MANIQLEEWHSTRIRVESTWARMVAVDDENISSSEDSEVGVDHANIDDSEAYGASNAEINDVYNPDFADDEDLVG